MHFVDNLHDAFALKLINIEYRSKPAYCSNQLTLARRYEHGKKDTTYNAIRPISQDFKMCCLIFTF